MGVSTYKFGYYSTRDIFNDIFYDYICENSKLGL
jgi:hypothetical protein